MELKIFEVKNTYLGIWKLESWQLAVGVFGLGSWGLGSWQLRSWQLGVLAVGFFKVGSLEVGIYIPNIRNLGSWQLAAGIFIVGTWILVT